VRFTEYDHVVQALPADRANESLDICILPGGDELKLQGGAAANAEREQGNEGGKNCEHAHDGMAVTRKSLAFFGLLEF